MVTDFFVALGYGIGWPAGGKGEPARIEYLHDHVRSLLLSQH
jgi:hypothetical protein